jgi:tetratricopeptide (TPR) repeat protein
LHELNRNDYGKLRSITASLDYNLVIESILRGFTPARIFVDSVSNPKTALIHNRQKLFIAGSFGTVPEQDLSDLITERIIPDIKAEDDALFLHVDSSEWKVLVEENLAGLYPVDCQRMYLECSRLVQDWRDLLPPGYIIKPVDEHLVRQDHLENIDYLLEELCSERPSIEDFLNLSFGFSILHGDALASWCLSEYNVPGRCEVGVATVDEHQQRGLATVATLALVEHALSNGIQRIGWHALTRNIPSVALALKAGFEKVRDYSVYLCVFDLRVQFGLKGSGFRSAGDYQEALAWYQRAIDLEGPPAWVYYQAACCQAQLGEKEAAFASLGQVLGSDFEGMDRMYSEPDLFPLHDDPRWEAIIKSLD